MPIQIQGGPAINVVVDNSGQRAEGGAAIPVAVVTDGRAVTGNKATRVVVVTNPDKVEGGPAIPVVAAPAGTPIEGGPAMRVYVVQGSLGGVSVPPANTALPSISGATELAATLTASTGSWSNSPTGYSYQWKRNGANIGGATGSTYVLTSSDLGTAITVVVTASNAAGSASATSAGTSIPNYLLLDRFTTDAAAPLTTPRTCEPGPGTLTIGTPANVSIAGGKLVQAASGVSYAIASSSIALAGGRALMGDIEVTTNRYDFGFSPNTTPATGAFRVEASNGAATFTCRTPLAAPTAALAGPSLNTPYPIAIVRRPGGGAFYVINGQLVYVTAASGGGTNSSALYPYTEVPIGGWAGKIDNMRVVDLGSPWDTDYGIATARNATPTTGASLTGTADGFIEFTWTCATGESIDLDFRRTDVDNRWIVRCSQAGSTIKLIERNAGIETERSSVAQTFNNGVNYRIAAGFSGALIRTYVLDADKNNYASGTFNQTATGVAASGFAAGSNLVAWPRSTSLPNF